MAKVLYETRERIAYVTFNRPEARNAIDPEMQELLVETWAGFADDDKADVAIVTGAGDAFCAGADLKTYIPPIIRGERPIRDIVDLGFGGRRAPCWPPASVSPRVACTRSASRSSERSTAGRSPADSSRRWPVTSG